LVERRGGTTTRRSDPGALPRLAPEAAAAEIEKRVRALLPLVADDCVRGPLEAVLADIAVAVDA
ncbi:hypothetical protein, partial [Devosia sp.]|uniref:hypothetical protein n=1 Tax=Devosia sp. TaxID=1871048 RepID=UPI002F20C577